MKSNLMRTWWKPWTWSTRTWVFAIVASVFSSPFVTRQICLWQIPDVALPFDVEDGIEADLPDDQNAYTVYKNVLKMLENSRGTSANTSTDSFAVNREISHDEITRRMLAHDERALAEYLRAGAMERGVEPGFKSHTWWTNLSLHNQLRQLVRNYSPLAITFEDRGEIDKAWAIHRANLQCSIHAEQTHMAICGLVAIALRSESADGIVHWASNPSITAQQLRTARNDILREYSRRIPYSAFAKGEYLGVRNSLTKLEFVDFLLPTGPEEKRSPMWLLIGKRIVVWCFGQPELTLRTNRQILVNNAAEFDKPVYLRRPSNQRSGQFIFDLDPNARRAFGQLDAQQLVRIVGSDSPAFLVNRQVLPWTSQFDRARQRDSAKFAAQEFQRSHGEFPGTIEQLVPSYLSEIPLDPFSEVGQLVNYRRDSDGTAVVWSVGPNGINDQGDFTISNNNYLDIGYQIKLNRPEARIEQEQTSNAVDGK